MGERLNGIQEVGSSILPGSTNLPNDYKTISRPSGRFWFMKKVVKTYKEGVGGVWVGNVCGFGQARYSAGYGLSGG